MPVRYPSTPTSPTAPAARLRAPPPRNRPKSLEAYDLCVRARKLIDDSPQTAREAHLMLTRAVSLDPDYAEAHRWLAMNHWMQWVHWGEPIEPNRGLALELARKAVAVDPNDAGCRWVLANLLAYERRFDEADKEFARTFELDPNEADAWATLSDITVLAGRVEEGLEHIRKAFRLIYRERMTIPAALLRIEAELGQVPAVRELIDFIRESKRGICGPGRFDSTAEDAAA